LGIHGVQVDLANPRGFCAGVDRAIAIVERALERFGPPVYVRHEVVHNRYVVDGLRARGAVFVDDLAAVPDGAILIFSAHGVPRAVQLEAQRRGLRVFDATCPLVTKVHTEVVRYLREGREVVLIGHAGHPEVEGTMGQAGEAGQGAPAIYLVETPEDARALVVREPARVAYVTQTTLSVDDTAAIIQVLRERFPGMVGPRRDDICYATQNRQNAVRALAEGAEVVLVVGSRNSSNSNRLREIAEKSGRSAYLVDGPEDVRPEWVQGRARVGVTAGASAPESLVQGVVARLRSWGATTVAESPAQPEDVSFGLPRDLD
jgi:4-hydroxy-3-methylbut-2-enyl diphosphate reductase